MQLPVNTALYSCVPPGSTHHINGVNVGKLREELATAEGKLGVGLEELLSGETKPDTGTTQLVTDWLKEANAAVEIGGLEEPYVRPRRDKRKSRDEFVGQRV